MARLPTYVNQAGLDIGSDTFRLSPDVGAAIGQGLSAFGGGLSSAGERLGRASLQAETKTNAIAERDASMRDEMEFIRLGDRIQQYALNQQNSVSDDAKGYTASVEKFAVDQYSELSGSGRLSTPRNAKYDLAFEKTRNAIVDKAATWEAQTRWKFQEQVYEARIKDVLSFVGTTGKEGLDQANAEWTDFVKRTDGDGTRIGRKTLEFGLRRIEQQAFKAEALKRGPEFTGQFQGLFTDTPSATSGNPQVDATLKHAPTNGIDPKTAVAIGWIESRLNMGHGKPIGKDGKPMSTAEGGWQILDGVAREFGLTPEQKRDPELATAAVMRHFAQNQDRIQSSGQTATPGKLYMYWNVGQGVAERILKADAGTPIEQIIYSSYPSRPGLAEQVLRNNPSLYRAGMTAGQVRENYERQMQRATEATAKFFSGSRVQSDDQTRAAVSSFMGRDMSFIGTADLVETFSDVAKTTKDATAQERNIIDGQQRLQTPGVHDPYDAHHKKVVNAAIEAQVGDTLVQGISRGDTASIVAAQSIVDAAGYVPDKVLHGYRAAIDSGSAESTISSLQALAGLARTNPVAYNASSLQADEKDMVRDYQAMTEVLGLDPGSAVKQIQFYRTPDGKKQRQVMADKIKAEWRNGGTDADAEAHGWQQIQSKFDKSVFSTPDTVTDTQRDAIVEAYRQGITYNRLQGYDVTQAEARTVKALESIWGVSTVASNARAQTLMPLPPEKVFEGKSIGGSFQWVQDQAKNVLFSYLRSNGLDTGSYKLDPSGAIKPNSDASRASLDFSLVPREGSVRDFLNGKPVSYEVWYRDGKGQIQKAVGLNFTPDYADAKAKADEDFMAARGSLDAGADARARRIQSLRQGR